MRRKKKKKNYLKFEIKVLKMLKREKLTVNIVKNAQTYENQTNYKE
ncbi:hypothetical protein HHA03_21460 [Halolactibacillus halophilus]|uniref:Fur-regulated basic protein B n=1 Tax=Halolactibacillus halophilus TaxID=306540 RepID=A0ABQ0VR63_9BACI|nr:hypothetical protein HHA03_21460 [Halolactibacillus halophilus]